MNKVIFNALFCSLILACSSAWAMVMPQSESVNLVEKSVQDSDFSQGLISALTSTLDISDEQASGGMGSLLEVAKSALSNKEFSTLANSIPGASDMLDAVPDISDSKADSASSMLGGFGGDAVKSLTSALKINEQFEALGLDQEMIAQFVDVSLNYLQSEQGQQAADLLKKGLSSLL